MSSIGRTAVLACALSGCAVRLPPPPALARSEMPVAGALGDPPETHGRVVIDADPPATKVTRITGFTVVSRGRTARAYRTEEALCITPCAVDLERGSHTLVFTAADDATKTSTADVIASSRTTFVKHALGRQSRDEGSYGGGAVLVVLGGLLTAGGGAGSIAAAASPRSGETPFLALGLVTLGLGVLTGTVGLAQMLAHRPFEQPGTTTQWTRP